MKYRAIALGVLASLGLGIPKSEAEPSATEQCLEQCKTATEDCVKAAGENADQLQECTTQALQCIESCKAS